MTEESKVQVLSHKITLEQRLGPEAIAQLAVDYRSGIPTTQLMTRYKLSKTSVLKLLRSNGVTMRRQPLGNGQVGEMINLYKSGLSVAAIANRFKASYETTRLALIRAGVQMRPRGGRYPS